MNNASIHRILTIKKFIKHPLRLLLPLTFASWCLPYKTPAAVSQNIQTPFSAVPLFNLSKWECRK